MKNKWLILVGAVVMTGYSTVQAVPILTLADNNGHSVSVNAVGGVASYVGGLGNWAVNIAGGLVNGTGSQPILDLSDNSTFSSAPGNVLTVTWTVDGLGPLAGSYINDVGGTLNGVTDVFSVLLNGVLVAGSSQSFSTTPFSGSITDALTAAGTANTVTLRAVLTAGTGGQTSFDDHFNPVPDGGATVMLLGTALSAFGLLRKKLTA